MRHDCHRRPGTLYTPTSLQSTYFRRLFQHILGVNTSTHLLPVHRRRPSRRRPPSIIPVPTRVLHGARSSDQRRPCTIAVAVVPFSGPAGAHSPRHRVTPAAAAAAAGGSRGPSALRCPGARRLLFRNSIRTANKKGSICFKTCSTIGRGGGRTLPHNVTDVLLVELRISIPPVLVTDPSPYAKKVCVVLQTEKRGGKYYKVLRSKYYYIWEGMNVVYPPQSERSTPRY